MVGSRTLPFKTRSALRTADDSEGCFFVSACKSAWSDAVIEDAVFGVMALVGVQDVFESDLTRELADAVV